MSKWRHGTIADDPSQGIPVSAPIRPAPAMAMLALCSAFRCSPSAPVSAQFEEGTIAFAGAGRNSRTAQLFIALGKQPTLGQHRPKEP